MRIDADPLSLRQGVGAHLSIAGDPCAVLRQLVETGKTAISPKTAWLQEARSRRDAFRKQVLDTPRPAGEGLHALDIMDAVQSVLTDDTVLLVDGGNIGQWVHQVLCDRYPGHWLTCGASGVIGYGIPGAMAARLLYPDRPIILISGDGSLTFTPAEFETASRQNLGFTAIVADDRAWGIVLAGHQQKYGEPITSELGPIRFDLMAEAFGAQGVRVERAGGLLPAIQRALGSNLRPTLIHVPVVRSSPADR